MANGQGQRQQQPVGAGGDWQDYKPSEQGWEDFKPAPAEASAKPGAITRFKHGLRSAMGFPEEGGLKSDIEQIGEGLKHEFTHPLDSIALLGKGAIGSQEDVAQKGVARMKQPGIMPKVEGAAQYLEAGIPMVGPMLSSAGESAETGDYAGMAGKMLPLAASSDEMVGRTRGALAEAVRSAPEVGGAVGGYAAGSTVGHPWVGGYAGREMGRRLQLPADRLADVIRGERGGPQGSPSSRIGGEWIPEGEQVSEPGSEATETLRGSPTPFGSKSILSIPGSTSSSGITGGAKLPKPRMSATETGQYLKSTGQSTGRLAEDIKEPAPEPSTYMKRKIDEAEGRHDARRMAATGAARGEDSRVGGQSGPASPEARPVPRKAKDLPTGRPKLKDEISEKGGGEGTRGKVKSEASRKRLFQRIEEKGR